MRNLRPSFAVNRAAAASSAEEKEKKKVNLQSRRSYYL